MKRKSPNVFLSYSWSDFKYADELDEYIIPFGKPLIRDTRDAKFGDNLTRFMQSRISKSDYVILLISDEYLKSENCMFEVIQLLKMEKFEKRALPVLIDEQTDIFTQEGRIKYHEYWSNNLKDKQEKAAKFNSEDLGNEAIKAAEIKLHIGTFFKKFIEKKAISFTALKKDNYLPLLKVIGFEEKEILKELFNITSIQNSEEREFSLNEFILRYPVYKPGLYSKAYLCAELSRFKESKNYFNKIIAIDGKEDGAYVGYGAILSNEEKEHNTALECFNKAIELNPGNELAWKNKGIVYEKTSRWDDALTMFKEVVKINPTNAMAYAKIANILNNKDNRYEEAKAYYEMAVKLNPVELGIYHQYALLLTERLASPREAIGVLEKAIEINKSEYVNYYLAGLLQLQIKEHEKAMEYLKRAVELNPNSELAHDEIGTIYALAHSEYDNAEKSYLRAIDINPKYAKAYVDLALLHSEYIKKDNKVALFYFERALAIDPGNVIALNGYAILLEELGRLDEAEVCLRKALEIQPDNENCNLNLAIFLSKKYERLGDHEKATWYFNKANELSGN